MKRYGPLPATTPLQAICREIDQMEWYSRPKGWDLSPEGAWDRLVDAADRAGYELKLVKR